MALFEIVDIHNGPPPPGPWRVASGSSEALAFGSSQSAEPGLVWRVDLPDDHSAALAAFALAEEDLRRQDTAIDAAPERMVRVAAPQPASYSVRGWAVGEPDRWLRGMIDELRGGSVAPVEATAYGLRDELGAAWQAAETRLQAFLAQVRDVVSNLAVVETRVAGVLVARTSVSLTGDIRSLVGRASPYVHAGLHRRTLGLALRSRAALLRTFGTVMRGAAIIATLTSSPVGAALALPAAWRFVEQVRDELRA